MVVQGETDNWKTYRNEKEQSNNSDATINQTREPEGLKVGYITELQNNKESLVTVDIESGEESTLFVTKGSSIDNLAWSEAKKKLTLRWYPKTRQLAKRESSS